MGRVPGQLLTGVPAHVDGRMIGITEAAGARVINRDRMWHYTEGITNYDPVWPNHGIRILPGPVVAVAGRHRQTTAGAAVPGIRHPGHAGAHRAPGTTTPGSSSTPASSRRSSASPAQEQNPDLTERSVRQVLSRVRPGAPPPVQAFVDRGVDFVHADSLRELVTKMNDVPDAAPLDYATVEAGGDRARP